MALHTLKGYSSWVTAVTFSRHGQWLASRSHDSTVRLWDANTGVALHTLKGYSKGANAVTFSRDGRRLASCSWDNTVRLWDANTGAALHTLEGYSGWVTVVTFSVDGRRLASCNSDKTVRLWDADTGAGLEALPFSRPLSTYLDHDHEVVGVSEPGRTTDPGLSDDLSISAGKDWIVYRKRRILWISAHFRSSCAASCGPNFGVRCRSGLVYRIGFNVNKLAH